MDCLVIMLLGGVSDRTDLIISYEDRTNDMLMCSGETFLTNNVMAPDGGYGNITNNRLFFPNDEVW